MTDKQDKSNSRGFAGMEEEKQREIASKGGKEAHKQGTAHEFDSAEAREAGRKGGQGRGSHDSQGQDYDQDDEDQQLSTDKKGKRSAS